MSFLPFDTQLAVHPPISQSEEVLEQTWFLRAEFEISLLNQRTEAVLSDGLQKHTKKADKRFGTLVPSPSSLPNE
jgi:hypothetical protein